MVTKLSELPQFTLNLRFLAKSNFPDSLPEQWSHLLATRSGISDRHVSALLSGEPPSQSDLEKAATAFGHEATTVGSAPLYGHEGETILRQNLRYLLGSLPKGGKARLAKSIGVRQAQLSRWEKDVTPEAKNLRSALKFFELDPDIDLRQEPLFLSLDPVGAHAQKEWLAKRVQSASPSEIGRLFEAFKLLLPPNAPD
jgi:transcriptional regulator with XRE-family HTH domain